MPKGGRGEGGPPVRGSVVAPAPLLPCSEVPVPCSSGREGVSHGDSVAVIQHTLWHKEGQHNAYESAIMQVGSTSGQNAVKGTQGNTVI